MKDAIEAFRDFVREVVREELGRADASDEWLSLRAAAEVAGVHPETVGRWVREDRLVAGKAGRSIRIRRGDLERFLAGPRRRQRVAELSPEELADQLFDD